MRLTTSNEGSIPLALLASIVTAGLITALVGTVLQSERTVRFDRSFTTVVQAADAGVQQAYHQLSNEPALGDDALIDTESDTWPQGPFTLESNGMTAEWYIDRLSPSTFEVESTGEAQDGTRRTVVSTIDRDALFFPGAFGDQLVGLQGQSTRVDSYESASTSCPGGDPDTCWGHPADNPFGTGKAALGTNGSYNFSGNVETVRRAILYDWEGNPPTPGSVTATNPGGSRCEGSGATNPCNETVLRMVDDKLEFGSDTEMAFINDKLGQCSADQWLHESTNPGLKGISRGENVTRIGGSHPDAPRAQLVPYSTDPADNQGSPADHGWNNYWCADSIQIVGHVDLQASAETPVVIFVQDSYSQASQRHVAWPGGAADRNKTWSNNLTLQRSQRPVASKLQLFVASDTAAGSTANISIANQAVFAGVVYAPRSVCSGESSNASADVYGSLICRTIQNVGNWRFHFDEQLADITRDTYTVATWREEVPGS
jgi:hypothetical protein